MTAGTGDLVLTAFGPEHLEGALALSRQAGWPHRREDWELALSLSEGTAALVGERVIGTALTTRFGPAAATANMILVDEAHRGRGVARRLMQAALAPVAGRELRLVATAMAVPLYTSLGFAAVGGIAQHQGVVTPAPAAPAVWAGCDDLEDIIALDAAAFGAERRELVGALLGLGRVAVQRRGGRIEAFAVLRRFGRGQLIGPVVAGTAAEARALIASLAASQPGAFLRIDISETAPGAAGLAEWLAGIGLPRTGGGTAMIRDARPRPATGPVIFALANQALG